MAGGAVRWRTAGPRPLAIHPSWVVCRSYRFARGRLAAARRRVVHFDVATGDGEMGMDWNPVADHDRQRRSP
jgi:hypothetical protein